MRNLKTIYNEIGASFSDALGYLGTEGLVQKIAGMFVTEPSYAALTEALKNGDFDAAFRAVHTMKSSTKALGLKALYDRVDHMTEMLRPGHEEQRIPADIEKVHQEIKAEYDKVIKAFTA